MANDTKLPPIAPGQRYGRLTAIEFAGRGPRNSAIWKFRCDCGVEIIKPAARVRCGTTKSCGCFRIDFGRSIGAIKKHGLYGTPEWVSWNHMLDRCRNQNSDAYEEYGGRGIKVCERWTVFENFLTDMGPRPEGFTLDRYPKNDGNYEPGNARWASRKQQANNRRMPRRRRDHSFVPFG